MPSGKLALIPTMGALHDGHISLITEAKKITKNITVTIFVNPTQFGPNEDFESYPRPIESDKARLKDLGVTLLTPTIETLYPSGLQTYTRVHVPQLDQNWCGKQRPGHFNGVTDVVSRLFNLIRPDIAFFGEKDFQQLAILKKMTQDLLYKIKIVSCPIIREPDGLAISSRNQYLNPLQRAQAPALYKCLTLLQKAFRNGEKNVHTLSKIGESVLNTEKEIKLDYLGIANPTTLKPVTTAQPQDRILIAAYLGTTRLIDNLSL